MSASSALYSKLTGSSAVQALAGTRVYAMTAPQNPTAPYVIYQQIAADPDQSHAGASGAVGRLFQVACFAKTYEGAIALRDAVIGALDGQALSNGDVPTLEDERDGDYDDTAEIYRADADFYL